VRVTAWLDLHYNAIQKSFS